MNTSLVSVLMTAYNRELYIAEAIESVLASGYTNFELIVVDDCSTDNTIAIARTYEQKDNRVKVYINEHNLGDYPNRNKAAAYAQGKYLKYLDADDIMYPHCIALMVEAMEKNPEAAYGFSKYGVQDIFSPFPISYSPYESYRQHFLMAAFFYAGPGGSIIRRDIFEMFNGFSGTRFIGDVELWMKLSAQYPCVMFWPGLIWWRQHDAQENKAERLDVRNISLRHHVAMAALLDKACPLSEKEIDLAKGNLERLYIRGIYFQIVKLNFRTAYRLKKEVKLSFSSFFTALFPVNKLKGKFKVKK